MIYFSGLIASLNIDTLTFILTPCQSEKISVSQSQMSCLIGYIGSFLLKQHDNHHRTFNICSDSMRHTNITTNKTEKTCFPVVFNMVLLYISSGNHISCNTSCAIMKIIVSVTCHSVFGNCFLPQRIDAMLPESWALTRDVLIRQENKDAWVLPNRRNSE